MQICLPSSARPDPESWVLISIFLAILHLILVGGVGSAAAQIDRERPAGPAADRLFELLEVTEAQSYARAAEFVRTAYGEEFRAVAPLRRHVDILLGGQPSGLRLHAWLEVDSLSAAALVENPITETWLRLGITVEGPSPHRITGVGLRPVDPSELDLPPDVRPPTMADTLEASLSTGRIARRLGAYLERLEEADLFSGAVLLARQGVPIFEQAYGEANKDFGVPNRIDTRFNLGSMNKMVTAVAILQLVAEGIVALDDPLARYLPNFPSRAAAEKIRIEHLLTHTSGLGSYFTEEFERGARARFRSVDDFMELAEGDSLRFEPGTDWRYSNTGFLVLGKVIEEATGTSYFDYVQSHVYRPVGMRSTRAYELDTVNENLAVGYEKQFTPEGLTYRNNLFDHVIKGGPAGGGYSTVGDLLRFAEALRSGTLLPDRYLEMLWSPKPDLGSPDYGYGFLVDTTRQVVGHGGGFTGISSRLEIHREQDFTAVVLSNYSGASSPVSEKIGALIRAAHPE